MTDTAAITRGEFEMLKQQVSDNAHRLDAMDAGGTRGVAVLQLQISDVAKDVSALKAQFAKHEGDHIIEAKERASLRRTAWRWGITTFIAFLALVEGPLLYLVVGAHS